MLRPVWRRFRPRTKTLDTPSVRGGFHHVVEEEVHQLVEELDTRRWRQFDIRSLDSLIAERKYKAETSGTAEDWMVALVLQAPRAVLAQRQMDKHPHGYRNQQARLFELIDFNDSFVSTVLVLPDEQLNSFLDELKRIMDRLCKYVKSPCFTDDQYEAITHGLSREIAVYRGAIKEGLTASMTSRAQDAKGIDMIISEPSSGLTINVDVKTRSAFYFRLKDLMHQGRITPEQFDTGELVGYCKVQNGHDGEAVRVVLLRIDAEELGDIANFTFEDTALLGKKLRRIIKELGERT